MTPKIVWLLDLDGVVNCTAPSWGEMPHQKMVATLAEYSHLAEEWRLRWAPTLIKRIRAVHELPHVEVRWSSTWCILDPHGIPQVRRAEDALRLPEMPCAFTAVPGNSQVAVHMAKRKAALDVLDAGQMLIWTDDEVVPEVGDPFRDTIMERGDSAMLLIRPKWNKGLTRENMDLIESFTSRI